MSQDTPTQSIELRVQELRQLFNSLDPSPFYEKDLDDEAERFLINWAEELPHDAGLRLVVHLRSAAPPLADTTELAEAIHNNFLREAAKSSRELRSKLREGRLSLIIGLLFLFTCVTLRELFLGHVGEGLYREIVAEGLLISGWVAMWRPLQTFLYDWWPIRRRRRLLLRLAGMPVELVREPPAEKAGEGAVG